MSSVVGSAILCSRRNYMSFKRILTNLFVVHFCWPSPDGTQSWHLVGHVTNQKPSLIFKVNNLKGKIKFHLKSPKHACGEFKILRFHVNSRMVIRRLFFTELLFIIFGKSQSNDQIVTGLPLGC